MKPTIASRDALVVREATRKFGAARRVDRMYGEDGNA
jgi:hypothetical protein